MNENVNVNIDAVMPEAAPSDKADGERMFTQSQLEEIISERLQRERKVNESLRTVKQVLMSATKKGIVKGGSYAEMASELVSRLKGLEGDMSKENEPSHEEAAENREEIPDITPYNGGKEKDVENDGEENAREEKDGEDFVSVLAFLKSSYPDAAVEKLFSGDLFERFAKGKSGSTREILSDFFDFARAMSERGETEASDGHSTLGSTAFSSEATLSDHTLNLTPRQMEMAKNSGLSYREYAHLLESIPKGTGRKF